MGADSFGKPVAFAEFELLMSEKYERFTADLKTGIFPPKKFSIKFNTTNPNFQKVFQAAQSESRFWFEILADNGVFSISSDEIDLSSAEEIAFNIESEVFPKGNGFQLSLFNLK